MLVNMVAHSAEYPWSDNRGNAMGKEVKQLAFDDMHLRLGASADAGQEVY